MNLENDKLRAQAQNFLQKSLPKDSPWAQEATFLIKELLETQNLVQNIIEERRLLFEDSPISQLLINESGKILDANEAFYRTFFLSKKNLLNNPISQYILPAFHVLFHHFFHLLQRTGNTTPIELVIKTGLNQDAYARVEASFQKSSSLYRLAFVNLTHQRKLEKELRDKTEQLRRNELQFRHLVESSLDVFFYQDIRTGRILYISDQVEKIFGLPPSTVLKMSREDLSLYLLGDYKAGFQFLIQTLEEAEKEGKHAVEQILKIQDNKGAYKWIRGSFSFTRDSQGKPIQLNGSLQDITDSIRREEELTQARQNTEIEFLKNKEALRNLQYATELAHISSFQCDAQGVSHEIQGNANWPFKDGTSIPASEWIHPEDLENHLRLWRKLLSGESSEIRNSYRSLYQGQIRYFNMVATMRPTQQGQAPLVYGIIQDITEQDAIKRKLWDAQDLWRAMINAVPFYFTAKDANNQLKYLVVNKAFADFMGSSVEKIIGKNDPEVFPRPEDTSLVSQIDQLTLQQDKEVFETLSATDSQGQVHSIRLIKKTFSTRTGQKLILGAGLDITELERAKLKETESLKLLQTLLDHLPVGIVLKDADNDFNYLHANPFYLRYIGKKREDVLGKNDMELHLFPGKEELYHREDQEVMERGVILRSVDSILLSHLGKVVYKKNKIPLKLDHHRNMLLICYEDITQISNLLQSERILYHSLEEVVRENDFHKSLDLIANTLMEQIGCDRFVLERFQPSEEQLAFYREWTRSGIPPGPTSSPSIDKRRSLVLRDLKQGKVINVSDASQSPYKELFLSSGVQSFLGVPISLSGEFWGALYVVFTEKKCFFSEMDESILHSTANIISMAQFRQNYLQSILRANREQQLILDHIPAPIWLYDQEGQLLRVNTAVCNLLKRSEAEILSLPCNETVCRKKSPPKDCPKLAAMASGKDVQINMNIHEREFIIHAAPIRDESGQLERVLECAVDVTSLSQKQKEIQNYFFQQKMLKTCLENSMLAQSHQAAIQNTFSLICDYLNVDWCCVLKQDSHKHSFSNPLEYHNPRVEPALLFASNLHLDELSIQENPWILQLEAHRSIQLPDFSTHPEVRQQMGTWEPPFRQNQVASLYLFGLYANEKLTGVFIIAYKNPRTLCEQELQFVEASAHVIETINERFQNREELLLALENAKSADKAKSFFIASVSHEIRTPLNAVIGFSELLQDTKLAPDTQRDYLKSISYSGNALLKIINDVLDLSKLQAGKMEIVRERTDFVQLCTEIGGIFLLQTRKKQIYLHSVEDAMPLLWIDKLRMRQILFNLIGNAVKFTSEGGITIHSTFTVTDDKKGTLTVGVSDTGMGISKEDLGKLTQPFMQFSGIRGSHSANNGTGLGLAICNSMIQSMGGEMKVESQLGKGSTFTLYLYDVAYEEFTPQPAEQPPQTPTYRIKKDSLCLLVDDIPMNIKVLESVFKKIGINTLCAHSGTEALEILKEKKIDMVLTDLWMPQMSGEKLAKEIHTLPEYESTPVVVITADVASHENFDMKPFAAILTKPITVAKLKNLFLLE